MKHIISFSGGVGSYMTADRVIQQEGKENVLLVFTDTKIEDIDLYRFMYDCITNLFGEKNPELTQLSRELKKHDDAARLMLAMNEEYKENFLYMADGRDVWEVFFDEKYIGNTRNGNCTKNLKQKIFRSWLEENFSPDECICYIGIDWSEENRYLKALKHWPPYTVKAPMCDAPFLSKDEMFEILKERGIELPDLYKYGFPHNNCGGFCVKAGQGQFKLLLDKKPELYKYHEAKEREFRETFGKDVSILRDRTGGQTRPLTLEKFRGIVEEEKALKDCGLKVNKRKQFELDLDDFGGCGCFPY